MKTCKQFLALFLALCMMLSVVPVSALATEDATADQPVVQASSEALSGEENTSEEEKASEEVNTSEEEQPSEGDKTSEEEQPSEENKTSEEEKTPEEGTTSEEEKAPEEDKTSEEEKTSEEDQASDDEPLPEEDSIMLLDEDTVQPRDTSSDPFYKILHLDCGRKYFSKDWIVALLYEMQAAGYNQLQLAFGNDGLRFLLNDMSFTANGTTYDHSTVVSKVEAGNSAQNYSDDTRWLTQAEMDAIISTANGLGIEIVPLLNLPGHANTLLDIFDDAYNASGSNNTFDVTNEAGLNCATAIFQKYVDYFAGKGCKFFNFGADEYANDADSGSFSFSRLDTAGYQKFVTFINSLATYIESKGMTPRAFNDGLYYNKQNDVSIDTAIQCCYWSSGWGSYPVASASTISGKGHGMINTHGDYYYVLKNGSIQNPLDSALNFSNTTFMGSTIDNPVGSMFCIWCDWPTQATEQEVAEDVRITLRQMAAAMSGTTVYSTEVVANGFKEDGSFNSTPSTPAEDKTVWNAEDDSKIISVTGPGLTTVTVEEVTPAYSADGATVVGYDITPYVDETPYSGNATVTIAVPEAVKECSPIKVYDAVNKAFVTSSIADGIITFTAAHFSEYDVVGLADTEIAFDETVTLEIGGTATKTQANVNNSGNVNKDNLNGNIATVEVTGVDAGTATTTYTQVSATCRTLISSDSRNWVAVDGYYYTPDGTNYYPVYAMRSTSSEWSWSSFSYVTTYTYTWGYSTANSASNVTEVGTQSTTSTRDTANIEVYTKATTGTDTPASTTITFTGVAHGTTYVTVGETTYQIVVNYKTKTVNVVVDNTAEVTVSGTADTSKLDTAVAEVAISGNTMTITGKAAGTTTVTVGDTIYTIKVTEEDLTGVSPLTIEYWITNARSTDDNNSNSATVSATAAHSEAGIAVTDIAPTNTTKEQRTLQYWRCLLLDKSLSNDTTNGTEEQTETEGDDDTYNGVEFTKVRYWNGSWAVYTVNNEWVNVADNNQLVAYYLEILPVADELTVTAADWGKKGDGSTSGDYLVPSTSCTISVRVVYEDGTTNPAGTTAADLAGNTIAYGYWENGRGVGTLNLIGLEGYQIWKVEAETGSESYASSSDTWGSYTVTNFTWDDNTMTVFEDAENPVDSYTIHNDAHNPSSDGYYQNLMWDENHEAILLTVYVKAKPTDDTLTVVYYDEKFGDTLYSYNINVKKDINFNDNITPEPAPFAEGSTRINVAGCGIENSLGVTQKFQTDLTQVPEAVGKYNSDLYSYTGSVISEDGKTLYLYYTIDTEVLSPMFVVDFGLPFEFNLSQVVNDVATVETVTVNEQTRYGTLSYDKDTQKFTYTPTQILPNIDVLTINILFDGETTAATTNAGVMPATTVYYEEGFATLSGFTGGSKGSGKQKAQIAGQSSDEYGFDGAYASNTGSSNGTEAISNKANDTATFTFTGTGFEVYANCTPKTGIVFVLRDENGATKEVQIVNTVAQGGDEGSPTEWQTGKTFYSLPIVSRQGLAYGTYTVTINHYDEKPVEIDGFRIYGTMQDQKDAYYVADQEDDPTFIELRDNVLATLNVKANNSEQYADQIAANTLSQVYSTAGTTDGVVLTSSSTAYTQENLTDLLDNGPKNEIFLLKDQALTFKVTTDREVQIGLKAPCGATSYTLNNAADSTSLSSSTDMFYTVLGKGSSGEQTITIKNTGDNVLSITKLKICDDPNATLGTLTADDLVPALLSLGFQEGPSAPVDPVDPVDPEPEVPTEPEVVYADASLTVSLADYAGNQVASAVLTANGVEGETHSFTADEILAAAAEQMPEAYALVDASAVSGVDVAYGAQQTASVQVGKVATLKVTYVNILGRKLGTATITKVQTSAGNCKISTSEIRNNAPAGRRVIWFTNAKIPYGTTSSLVVPVI